MNSSSRAKTLQNHGSPLFYSLMIMGGLLSPLVVFIACFLPAVSSTVLFRLVNKRTSPMNSRPIWRDFWAMSGQLSLYIGGSLTLRNAFFVQDHFNLDGLWVRICQHSSWHSFYLCFMFIFLPSLMVFFIELSRYLYSNRRFKKVSNWKPTTLRSTRGQTRKPSKEVIELHSSSYCHLNIQHDPRRYS